MSESLDLLGTRHRVCGGKWIENRLEDDWDSKVTCDKCFKRVSRYWPEPPTGGGSVMKLSDVLEVPALRKEIKELREESKACLQDNVRLRTELNKAKPQEGEDPMDFYYRMGGKLVPNKETQEAIEAARRGEVDPWFGVQPSIVVPDPQDAPYDHT